MITIQNSIKNKERSFIPKPLQQENPEILTSKDSNNAEESISSRSIVSTTFGNILAGQINSMVDNVKKSLSELKPSIKDDYKRSKELAFDLKNLLRGMENLEDINIRYDTDENQKEKFINFRKTD